eukprot:TRINITY_DN9190_c0_g1_i1.p1 TRINITY_DN9190_c0_g1~~TRINITY_DN9190_c0_g1_i1.p1  ORF type:complete len:382 (+),score=67.65 TRINITY_DN9190_c0_g1_i1:95-1240(+)
MATLTVFGALSSFASDLKLLIVLRFIVGVAVAGTPSALTLFTESLPAASRGSYTILFMYFFSAGAVAITVLGWMTLTTNSWSQLLFCAALAPAVSLVLCTLFLPSSPRFLLAQDKPRQAFAALQAMAAANNKSHALDEYEPEQLVLASRSDTSQHTKQPDPQLQTKELKNTAPPETTSVFALMASEFFLMAVVYYFLVLVTVKLESLAQRGAVSGEIPTLSDAAFRNIIIANMAEVPGLAVASYCLDRYGRRGTIAGFFLVTSLALLVIGGLIDDMHSHRDTIAVCVWTARAAALGFNQSLWIFATEAFPTQQRASLLSWATAFARVGGALSPWITDTLFARYPAQSCTLIATISLLAAYIIQKVPVETALKPLREATWVQ